MKVINFDKFKELKELQKCEESYSSYLKSLGNSQLEIEVNSLLEEFSGNTYGNDFFSKGKLIMNEISSRAHEPIKTQINKLSQDTFRLL